MSLKIILATQPDIEDIVEETAGTGEEFSVAPLVVLGIAVAIVLGYALVRYILNRARGGLPDVDTSAVVQPAEFQTDTALRFDDVKVSFATEFGTVEAVKGVSFDIKPGEVVAVVGESGSGKSVTSSTAMGLMSDNATVSGRVFLDGTEITDLSPAKLRSLRGDEISMVFQEPMTALNPVLKVSDQLVEALQVHNKAFGREALAQAVRLLQEVGIPDAEQRIHEYPHQFSGGQRQRIVIAIAIACNPKVIIADEPTTALDVTVQADILDLLRRLKDELNTGILLITHNVGVVADMADRVVVMFQGEVVESGPAEQILLEPEHPYTKRLLEAVPTLRETEIEVNEPAPAADDDSALPSVDPGAQLSLQAKDLALAYKKKGRSIRVVEGVNFAVARGEILGLVGESGSGKSTAAKAVLGLLEVEEGELLVRGQNLPALPRAQQKALRREIGVVFQDPAASLDPRFPIGEIITEPMVVHNRGTSKERIARAEELLDAVKLPRTVINRYPHELSGGQRQRISIARAMALSPSILIADEPTSALDVSVQARVLDMFVDLQEQYDFACLFVTHDLAVVDQLADQIMVMEKGRVVEQGRKEDILRNPQEDYTKRLLAAAPVPHPEEQRIRREARHELLASQGRRRG
ncbi:MULTISPECIES: ABC transporter ATP-binding protein [Auritidibacter]|uniref:ABC transporter ATP-binding protein n=1 Tax=Auritidibacter TaxID=1160973 RepID=UPI000D72CB99|nr:MULTISPECIES: ABC transporter ATP-binding protein [Auritidibacter]PXA80603.1 glutathione ABC transporter ATP-binding protein [Auritidibacter sp. NML120636]WGH85697.1 ABC transporter ATP-binding protein [Auritidibacter ignavus]WGH87985.1 ABC transporter ATP-binding protein [Auritidibacter ignavus]